MRDEHRRLTLTARLGSALVLVVVCGVAVAAQKNPFLNYTEEKFVQNMQVAGRNYAAVNDMLAKGDYESAKAQLTRAREQLAITVTFWRDRKKDDAAAMLKTALSGMDELDVALSATTVDSAAVKAVSQKVNTACQACHVVYRTQDPATKTYRIKPGSI